MKYLTATILVVIAVFLSVSRCSNSPERSMDDPIATTSKSLNQLDSSSDSKATNSGRPLRKLKRSFLPELTEEEVIAHCLEIAKSSKICLDLFASDFNGEYPSEYTWKELENFPESEFKGKLRQSSNWYLQQFITKIGSENEGAFYTPLPGGRERSPDGDGILESGECGFSYVRNLTQTDYSGAPLLMTPMVDGTLTFDQDALFGKAIVVFLDSSVRVFDVNPDGTLSGDGAEIFEMKRGRNWGMDPILPNRISYPSTL